MTDATHQARPAEGLDLTHMAGRVARPADAPDDGTVLDLWSGRVPEHFPKLLNATASEYARQVTAGGTKLAHAYLARQRQEAPEWLNPWAFIEAVAERLARKDG